MYLRENGGLGISMPRNCCARFPMVAKEGMISRPRVSKFLLDHNKALV